MKQRKEFQELLTYTAHGARSEGKHEIAGLNVISQSYRRILESSDVPGVLVSETFDRFRQRLRSDSLDWFLAGRIDVGDEQRISVIE